MKKIAIIGANGQVGSEVSLLLSMMPDVEVVPICRTEIGSAFLRRVGLPVKHAAATDIEVMREALEGCDLVADFSLPVGGVSEVRDTMKEIIPNLAEAAPAGAPFVYLSSITAFGIKDFRQPLKYYPYSQNIYGSSKRVGEKLALKAAKATDRPGYVLRVGVVHGDLQMVTRKLQQDIRTAGDVLTSIPDCESYAVFAVTIAQGLVAIANGLEKPGTYTMLPNPGVQWKDMHEWYSRRVGIEPNIQLLDPDPEPSKASQIAKSLLTPLKKIVYSSKALIAGYLAASSPDLESKLRTIYHLQSSSREINQGLRDSQYRPYNNNHTRFPGARLENLTDPLAATDRYTDRIYQTLDEAVSTESIEGGEKINY